MPFRRTRVVLLRRAADGIDAKECRTRCAGKAAWNDPEASARVVEMKAKLGAVEEDSALQPVATDCGALS
jgi:hypothetical protein